MVDETLSLRRVRVYISSLIKTVQVTALSLSFFLSLFLSFLSLPMMSNYLSVFLNDES